MMTFVCLIENWFFGNFLSGGIFFSTYIIYVLSLYSTTFKKAFCVKYSFKPILSKKSWSVLLLAQPQRFYFPNKNEENVVLTHFLVSQFLPLIHKVNRPGKLDHSTSMVWHFVLVFFICNSKKNGPRIALAHKTNQKMRWIL